MPCTSMYATACARHSPSPLHDMPCTDEFAGYVGVKGRDGAVVTKAELDKAAAAAAAAGGSGARKNQAAKSTKKKKGAKKAK